MTIDKSDKKVKIGDNVTYIITIINNGTTDDIYDLKISNPKAGWEAKIIADEIEVNNIEIEPHILGEIHLIISPPEEATSNEFEEITFTSTSRDKPSLKNSIIANTTIDESYGIQIDTSEKIKYIEPGESVEFSIELRNSGNIEDNYEFETTSLPINWYLNLDEKNITDIDVELNAFETKTISILIFSYKKVIPGEIEFHIKITSKGDTDIKDTMTLTIIVIPSHEFELESNSLNYVDPGDMSIFTVKIYNHGNVNEEISLSVNSSSSIPLLWNFEFENGEEEYNITVSKFESKTIIFKLFTHENATYNTDSKIIIDAKNDDFSTSKNLRTIIHQIYGIEVTCKYNKKAIFPGEIASYTILVRNTGNGQDIFYIETSDPINGWDHSINEGPGDIDFKLDSKQSKTLTLAVFPPDRDIFETESKIMVIGESNFGSFNNITITTNLIFVYDLDLTIPEPKQEIKENKKVKYAIKVTNNGNGKSLIEFEYSTPPNGWTVELDPLKIELEKSESFDIILEVFAPPDVEKGTEVTITVTAKSGNLTWSVDTTTKIITENNAKSSFNFYIPLIILILIFIPLMFLYKRRSGYRDYYKETESLNDDESTDDFPPGEISENEFDSDMDFEKELSKPAIPFVKIKAKDEIEYNKKVKFDLDDSIDDEIKNFGESYQKASDGLKQVPKEIEKDFNVAKNDFVDTENKENQIPEESDFDDFEIEEDKIPSDFEEKEPPLIDKDTERNDMIEGYLAHKTTETSKVIEQIQKRNCPVCGRTVFISTDPKEKTKCVWCGTMI